MADASLQPELLIAQLGLLPHPEGGFYKETYRSSIVVGANILGITASGTRSLSTAIYFLLLKDNFSAFHRIKSDECWHFYAGQTLLVHVISPDGALHSVKLGSNLNEGEVYQYVVPAGCWFASETAPGGDFSFVGCTVAPGFDFADFEMAEADTLCADFPMHQNTIRRLCR